MRKVKTFQNRFHMKGRSQIWEYPGGCEFDWPFHKGKVEWHHPISSRSDVGIWLCEAHHSLLRGIRKLYPDESIITPKYELMTMLNSLIAKRISEYGFTEADIDKY